MCVVLRDDAPSKYGKLIIPEKYKTYPTIGIVVAVGSESDKELMGRKVLFPHLSGLDVSLKNQPFYTIFRMSELLAVIEAPDDEVVEFKEENDELIPAPLSQAGR
jgi:co-chaperonin GroES (HSP10)